jgi:hypothetical protein
VQDFLQKLLIAGAINDIDNPDDDGDPTPRFRGANTPNFYEGKFTIDGASHCPRQAICRKRGIETRPSIKNLLSWKYGRAWEELMKRWIEKANYAGLSYIAEEDALIQFYSFKEEEKRIYTARPDLLITYNTWRFPVECKSVQSESTGKAALIDNKPKLGAVMQMNSAMVYHECDIGFTLYGLMTWLSGYDFATKSRFKLEPSFNTHYFERHKDGNKLVYNGINTIVSTESLADGLALLESLDADGVLPTERPISVDLFGHKAGYDQCTYCDFRTVCDQYGKKDTIEIEDFIDRLKMEVNVYERAKPAS